MGRTTQWNCFGSGQGLQIGHRWHEETCHGGKGTRVWRPCNRFEPQNTWELYSVQFWGKKQHPDEPWAICLLTTSDLSCQSFPWDPGGNSLEAFTRLLSWEDYNDEQVASTVCQSKPKTLYAWCSGTNIGTKIISAGEVSCSSRCHGKASRGQQIYEHAKAPSLRCFSQ